MSDFERGVRFVMERRETLTYAPGDDGDDITRFGDFQMAMEIDRREMTAGSLAHRERRIRAVLELAKKEGLA